MVRWLWFKRIFPWLNTFGVCYKIFLFEWCAFKSWNWIQFLKWLLKNVITLISILSCFIFLFLFWRNRINGLAYFEVIIWLCEAFKWSRFICCIFNSVSRLKIFVVCWSKLCIWFLLRIVNNRFDINLFHV